MTGMLYIVAEAKTRQNYIYEFSPYLKQNTAFLPLKISAV
jgi:hypothetical protein